MNNDFLADLKAIQHWVAYRLHWDKERGKAKKVPIDVGSGKGASVSDAHTWSGYWNVTYYATHESLFAAKSGGIGFVLDDSNDYAVIDLDNVIDDNGNLKDWAAEVVETMNSYTEFSPSGHGLHIWFTLSVPYSELCTRNANHERGIEIYDTGHYFTVTEKPFGEAKPIAERTQELKSICAMYFPVAQNESSTESLSRCSNCYEKTNSELWEILFNSQRGNEIRALYNGNTSSYGSPSEADLRLCNALAFITGKDSRRMDEMFRETGLYRAKWDEKHSGSGSTYGEITIQKAIDTTRQVYETTPKTERPDLRPQVGGASLFSYLNSQFASDLAYFSTFKGRLTGFANLDMVSLYPGLYVVGGVSGAGKTTFCHQLADNLAKAGEFVLYFSLEQTRFELVTKGLARLTAIHNLSTAVTALKIRNGCKTDAVLHAIGDYKAFAEREQIFECGFDTTAETIINKVRDFINRTGNKPVIIIDYLQIITPSSSKKSTKEAVDDTVHALKKLQADNGLVMFVISSFNRTNYLQIADFESFKESGLIEYSADVVWALQLSAMNAGIFDKESKLQSKRNFVHLAKNENPRKIELLSLKNRYGRSFVRYFFLYNAEFDLFEPRNITEEEADAEVQAAFEAFDNEQRARTTGIGKRERD